jgi:hypothetical protein
MMVVKAPAELPLGIFELDAAGSVIAYSVHHSKLDARATRALVGKDFFGDVLHGGDELKQRFRNVYNHQVSFTKFLVSSKDQKLHSVLMMFFPDTSSVMITIDRVAIA